MGCRRRIRNHDQNEGSKRGKGEEFWYDGRRNALLFHRRGRWIVPVMIHLAQPQGLFTLLVKVGGLVPDVPGAWLRWV
jgi:hypothetical protein